MFQRLLTLSLTFLLVRAAFAGGSGLNTIVVVNQLSSNSCELGNYYCERRQVPPENLLRISWPGGNIAWTPDDFQTNLVVPLLSMLSSRALTNQIDFVVLSMDIPFRIFYGSGNNSTTSALFYGLKDEAGPDYLSVTNSYAASEQIFANAHPASAPGFSFLTTIITAPSLALAKRLVDQGVTSDGLYPYQPVLLAKSSDSTRNIRYKFFDNALFNTRLCRYYTVQRTNCDSLWGQTNLLGLQTGLANLNLSPDAFAPGAMADDLTSWGGIIFGYNDQTSLISFITNGASGSYGSVNETAPIPDKFPNPQNYFYQARGFSIAECYYQSLAEPFQGLMLAEPLASPRRRLGSGKWPPLTTNSPLSGTTSLALHFSAADISQPLQQLDLFVDGKFLRTLTNLPASPANILTVSLNGYPVTCTNPPNSSLASVASNLVSALNAPAITNITKVIAFPAGDRLELHSTSTNALLEPFFYTDPVSPNSFRLYRVVMPPQSNLPALSASGLRADGAFQLHLENPASAPLTILASTNLSDWVPIFTNLASGPLDFVDTSARYFSKRFYRLAGSILDPRPALAPLGYDSFGVFKLRVDAVTSAPYILQASTDLLQWTSLTTNLAGGDLDFLDTTASAFDCRFYRAALIPPPPSPQPRVSFVSQTPAGNLIRIDNATQPYILQVSSDLFTWSSVFTNSAPGQIKTAVRTDPGSSSALTTFLTPARDSFLASPANGYRTWTMNGSIQPGSWLQITITKTNGARINLSVTNQILGGTVSNLTSQLATLINASPALQGPDGLSVQDLGLGSFQSTTFNLVARSAALDAAAIKVLFTGSPSIYKNPSRESPLNQNLSDLQPRNHLYVSAGALSLSHTLNLDTTLLPDGYHELTAVAYEGTHVHTQTRATLPITISNSPLSATLTLLDLAPTNSVTGTYHLQVSANNNTVTAIRIYSTGGLLNTISNQPSAVFTIDASFLGSGLHPFYAIVDTPFARFRTQPRYLRFQ